MLTARQMDDDCDATAKKYFSNFRNLFLIYAAVIRDGIIVKDRNELVYEIASSELKHYIKWYRAKNVHEVIASFFSFIKSLIDFYFVKISLLTIDY